MVTDTLTSDVVTTSTDGAEALEDLEHAAEKPYAISMRLDVMSTTVTSRLQASAASGVILPTARL